MTSELFEPIQGDRKMIRCLACPHKCLIPDGAAGRCFVRRNTGGRLQVPGGGVAAFNIDPVEKKPFYHFLPGAATLSFGMSGCNFHCAFCQNWQLSQPGRDSTSERGSTQVSAEEIVQTAIRRNTRVIASTYNEPLISSEWAVEIFKKARPHGIRTAFVSNGFASPEALDFLSPHLDAINIDLKCFTDEHYQELGGRLEPVLATIRTLVEMGKWVEITTLVVPGFNDSDEELQNLTAFLAGLNPDIPWHVSAYHEAYKYKAKQPCTPVANINRAVDIGESAGLKFVYSGNMPLAEGKSDTRCPHCGDALIRRRGFQVARTSMDARGQCPHCDTTIPGIWN